MRRLLIEQEMSAAAIWARRLAVLSLAVLSLAILLARWGRLDPLAALASASAGLGLAIAAVCAGVLAFVAIWRDGRPGFGRAAGAVALALALLAWPALLAVQSLSLPRLTDVTTDIVDPPAFSRSRQALAARGSLQLVDPPPESRTLQRSAYPRLAPFLLDVPVEDAFRLAETAAGKLGWTIVERVRPGGRAGLGRIEAVDRSLLFRFPDDITVRATPLPDGSRLDVRSASRVGEHDFGANAARIERFFAAIAAEIEAQPVRALP